MTTIESARKTAKTLTTEELDSRIEYLEKLVHPSPADKLKLNAYVMELVDRLEDEDMTPFPFDDCWDEDHEDLFGF